MSPDMDEERSDMLSPTRQRQLEELDIVNICVQILSYARNELYINMHFLDLALSGLRFEADSSVSPVATDGYMIYYNPDLLCKMYRKGRVYVNRAYLHMVFHCLFCHLDTIGNRDRDYWDLSCDIAMESIIDKLYKPCIRIAPSSFRRETYLRLEKKMDVLTAEGIYKALKEMNLSEKQFNRFTAEFRVDDHKLWYEDKTRSMSAPRQNDWNDRRGKMQTQIEISADEPGVSGEGGPLLEEVQIENHERYDYRRFLRKFAVLKEEMQLDDDSFDYAYYTFGLRHYGNVPLIEPLESKEIARIEDFVIVVDTSMSCSGSLVRRFLEETYNVLSETETFFKKVNIRIIQCDDKIRSDVLITNAEDMDRYMENFTIKGMGGTDFRPAFEYVNSLIKQGVFTKLKGLLYFTDGKGIYPVAMPPYDTAFVFVKDQYRDESVPAWAMKVILSAEDLELMDGKELSKDEY